MKREKLLEKVKESGAIFIRHGKKHVSEFELEKMEARQIEHTQDKDILKPLEKINKKYGIVLKRFSE